VHESSVEAIQEDDEPEPSAHEGDESAQEGSSPEMPQSTVSSVPTPTATAPKIPAEPKPIAGNDDKGQFNLF
jgi:hypothetical protein